MDGCSRVVHSRRDIYWVKCTILMVNVFSSISKEFDTKVVLLDIYILSWRQWPESSCILKIAWEAMYGGSSPSITECKCGKGQKKTNTRTHAHQHTRHSALSKMPKTRRTANTAESTASTAMTTRSMRKRISTKREAPKREEIEAQEKDEEEIIHNGHHQAAAAAAAVDIGATRYELGTPEDKNKSNDEDDGDGTIIEPQSKKLKIVTKMEDLETPDRSDGARECLPDVHELHRLLAESLQNRDSAITWLLKISHHLVNRDQLSHCPKTSQGAMVDDVDHRMISLFVSQMNLALTPSPLLVQYLRQALSSQLIHPVSFFSWLCDRGMEDGRSAWLSSSVQSDEDGAVGGSMTERWRLAAWNEYVLLMRTLLPELRVTVFNTIDKYKLWSTNSESQNVIFMKSLFQSRCNSDIDESMQPWPQRQQHSVSDISLLMIRCIRLLLLFLCQCSIQIMDLATHNGHTDQNRRYHSLDRRFFVLREMEHARSHCVTSLRKLLSKTRVMNMLAIARTIHEVEWRLLCHIVEQDLPAFSRSPTISRATVESNDSTQNAHGDKGTPSQIRNQLVELRLSLQDSIQAIDSISDLGNGKVFINRALAPPIQNDSNRCMGLMYFVEEQVREYAYIHSLLVKWLHG